MQPDSPKTAGSKWMFWLGWVLSCLPALVLIMSGVMKFVKPDGMEEQFQHLGWDMSLALGLGVVELACTFIYLVPQTAVFGAVLLTGYLGGAVATHQIVRPQAGPQSRAGRR